jgi:RNA polymerase sigma-70 factor (ECF subfamily)
VSEPSERELDARMARLADGDRTAFDPLFAALHPRAVALARLRLRSTDAEDAAQEALVRVFARASEFVPGRPALPWFYAVAANEVHGAARRLARAQGRDAGPEAAAALVAPGDPESSLVLAELRAVVRSAIGTLDVDSANAILASIGEAPHEGALSPALRKRVSRAYARLRILLGGRP